MSVALPPLPPNDIYIGTSQGQQGPFALQAVVQQLAAGQLPPDASIWYQGMSGWMRVADHPELQRQLAASRGPVAAPGPPASAPARSDDELDRVFVGLIDKSWKHFNANHFAHHVDEVFIGAVITSTLDNNYSLIDLGSDGSNHYLRFQNMQDQTRLIYRLNHLAHTPTEAKVMGHMASVTIGYGERVANAGRLWNALKAEFKSGYIVNTEPGTITVDADIESGYIYTQVDMFWNISDYVTDHYETDYPKLTEHVGASVNALRKYLRGRMV